MPCVSVALFPINMMKRKLIISPNFPANLVFKAPFLTKLPSWLAHLYNENCCHDHLCPWALFTPDRPTSGLLDAWRSQILACLVWCYVPAGQHTAGYMNDLCPVSNTGTICKNKTPETKSNTRQNTVRK